MKIIELKPEHAMLHAEHISRNIKTSGVDGTPFFTVRSAREEFDIAGFASRTMKAWDMPAGEHGWARTWSVMSDNKVVAAIDLDTIRLHPRQVHRALLGLGIEKDFRGKGCGAELMQTCISWAKQQSFLKWIDLGVFADNHPARRLYEKFGFIETGRNVDLFRIDGHSIDDIQMTLEL